MFFCWKYKNPTAIKLYIKYISFLPQACWILLLFYLIIGRLKADICRSCGQRRSFPTQNTRLFVQQNVKWNLMFTTYTGPFGSQFGVEILLRDGYVPCPSLFVFIEVKKKRRRKLRLSAWWSPLDLTVSCKSGGWKDNEKSLVPTNEHTEKHSVRRTRPLFMRKRNCSVDRKLLNMFYCFVLFFLLLLSFFFQEQKEAAPHLSRISNVLVHRGVLKLSLLTLRFLTKVIHVFRVFFILSVNAAFERCLCEKQLELHLSRGCQMFELGAMKRIGGVQLWWDFAMRYIGNKPMMERCHGYMI